ncbi:hypothetical protein MMC10_011021 [Thelotrema lepadinum]|nr:hypothetical protein [Thelotrema lepadinum]
MVKHGDFKRCDQSGFCKRNRDLADSAAAQGSSWVSPYKIDEPSIAIKDNSISATILKNVEDSKEPVRLPLSISFLRSGAVRIEIDEEKRRKGDIELRHDSKVRKERYNEAAKWAIVGGLEAGKASRVEFEKDHLLMKYGPNDNYQAHIFFNPFRIDFVRDGKVHIKFNGKGLMNVEHWRPKIEKKVEEPKEGEEDNSTEAVATEDQVDESIWWDESFGGNTDSKPRGPESIALDITFPDYEHVFGIPEHAGPLSLKETRGGSGNYDQPYRLYNCDVFEYEMDSPMTLYGAIPFMQAHRKDSTVGVFWLNGAETWVDIVKAKQSKNPLSLESCSVDTETHWMSESGVLDIFVFLGPSPKDLIKTYSGLTGTTAMPPEFAIAYHQCRWNYVTDEDVKEVDRKFDKNNIPFDVIWLDIEYTEGKKYFTWDSQTFPDPIGMQKQLAEHERKLVAIIDPHYKNEDGYHVSDQLRSKDLAVKDKGGSIYQGWCWPGNSHWIDCFNPAARKWFNSLFEYSAFKGSAVNTWIWNDMNEPSVFNGPEMTMPKDNIFYDGWEHRDIHNINGLTFHNATYEALLARDKGAKRPFALTRSFFAGSQRLSAMWTGDNLAEWSHLFTSIPMVLANNIAGYPFAGADVGGFFGNPAPELLTRWYQAGIFYPFFRAHAHIDTRRREPYLSQEPYKSIIVKAIRLRYSLLPVWYTAFQESSATGQPIVRPNFYVHPSDEKGFAVDDQLYIGSTGLLAKPVTKEGAATVDVYLADSEKYYDYFDYTTVSGAGKTHTLAAPIDKITLLMQGGHIFPRKERPRRSSGLMKWDPYTLVIVLDNAGNAEGTLYVDDGETFDYRDGAHIHQRFTFGSQNMTFNAESISKPQKKTNDFLKTMSKVRTEKLIFIAAPESWKGKTGVLVKKLGAKEYRRAGLTWHKAQGNKASWAVVQNPNVGVGDSWSIDFSMEV